MGNDIDLVNTSEDNNKNENNKDNSNNNDNPIFCPICNQNLTGFSNIVDIFLLFYFFEFYIFPFSCYFLYDIIVIIALF